MQETQGRRPGVEEVAGSCPWWRRAWARKAAGFQPPGRSPDRRNGEARSQLHRLRGWGCSQALAHTSKDYFQKRVLTCGQRWLRRARLRTSKPAAGGAPGSAVVVFDPWGPAAVAEI